MRVISGFVAAMLLAALSQPAFAVCVNRGGAVACHDDPKWWKPSAPESGSSAEDQPGSVKMIVVQPAASSANAWVMTPQSGDSPIKPASANTPVPACEPGLNC